MVRFGVGLVLLTLGLGLASPSSVNAQTSGLTRFVSPWSLRSLVPKDSEDFRPFDTNEPDSFVVELRPWTYVLGPSGAGERRDSSGRITRFTIPIDSGGFFVNRLSVATIGSDPLFVYEETDNEGGAGFATRLDARALTVKWTLRLPGFNVGVARLDGGSLFVTCFGFVGRIDLSSGRYLWRLGNLYVTDSLNYFGAPALHGDTLVLYANAGRVLRVNSITGRRVP